MNCSSQIRSDSTQQASGGWLEREDAGYHSTGPVFEVGYYEEMADDQQCAAVNSDSLGFVERMTAKGLLTKLKGKRLELARKAAEEALVERIKVPWVMAGNSIMRAVFVVDEGVLAVYYCD